MRRHPTTVVLALLTAALPVSATAADRVETTRGVVEGTTGPDGLRSFLGIPYARPPVGDLRWKPPQPPERWEGVRKADAFGPRAMQRRIFADMVFRSRGVSEDCLYLNVWTPATGGSELRPVLVYFYGGGFVAGDGSEPRYEGASMARRGIVAVTVNYRLGVFGFLAHPDLTKESPHHASGNYGLLDQHAALEWVRENIAAFGGDPKRVTIGGESAGSISVSAQMASPLSKSLFAGAIAESGSLMRTLAPVSLAGAEKVGLGLADKLHAKSIADLRAIPAEKLLEDAATSGVGRFPIAIDGYFLPREPGAIFEAGEQAHVPLLVGWNTEESGSRGILGDQAPTRANFEKVVKNLYKNHADEILSAYPGETEDEVRQAATDLASDRFIAYGTWKLADLHARTGGKPVYRYLYAQPRPGAHGAVHSAEIEYALGNLATNKVYAWTPDDFRVSVLMQGYFARFIQTGDPNGPGLPEWPALQSGDSAQYLRIDAHPRAETDRHRNRYLLLDRLRQAKD